MAKRVRLTIDWRQGMADVPLDHQETITTSLFQDLSQLDEVDQINRVADPQVPAGGMGVAAWLWSILTAEITIEGIKALGQDVQARLPGKPIEFTLEAGGKSISVKNLRPADLDATLDKLVAAAQDLANDSP
ncbi:uncharacterized protein XM38_043440 [Halomicronema hongdechloris C2206]|uniref:Uncharacterized protein n=1 Tax=Halomicronema hongdechloris C2206 TaxID=1641165 RepID=A0A1Z3HSV2_9CYAN|nr:hypothetical protein [Halomicronema hongdechloris]ASC73379.1 uncharacterized protein XM38_043440 [Halomicronema hongdechloris C2206]